VEPQAARGRLWTTCIEFALVQPTVSATCAELCQSIRLFPVNFCISLRPQAFEEQPARVRYRDTLCLGLAIRLHHMA